MPENGFSARDRRTGRLWAFRMVKLVVSMAALVVILGLASKTVTALFASLPDDSAVLGVVSAAVGTVFAFTISRIEKTLSALGSLSRWIVDGRWSGFLPVAATVGITLLFALCSLVLCVGLVFYLIDPQPSSEERLKKAMKEHGYTTERAHLLDKLAMLETPRIDVSEDRFRIPILFERGQLKESEDPGFALRQDVSETPFSAGLDYAWSRGGEMIRALVTSLAPCGAAEGGRPVRLRVEGYASSEPFERAEGDASQRLNLHLANERRRAVEGELRGEIRRLDAEGVIDLDEVGDYTEISEMERDRQFNDRPGDSPPRGSYEQDVFTRAAHIRVLDLAECSYEGP